MRGSKGLCLALAACAASAVAQPQIWPSNPPRITAAAVTAASATSLRVDWHAQPGHGGYRIAYCIVGYRKRTASVETYVSRVSPFTSITLTGLTAGDVYVVRVRAVDGNGLTATTDYLAGVPQPVVSGSLAVTAAVASGSSARVSWTPTPSTLSATGYEVSHQGGASRWNSRSAWVSRSLSGGSARSATLTGLTPGQTYAVRVCARTTAGRAPCGLAWAAPNEKPGRPAAPTVAVASRASLRVSWSAPSNGGTAIVDYDVRHKRSSASAWTNHPFTGTGTATTIAGLATDAAYDVQVRAVNAAGASPYSLSGAGTPTGRPGAPAAPTLTVASGRSLRVSWRPPARRGDSAVTDYDVRYRASGASSWSDHPFTGTGTATTIAGLTAGTTYSVQVRARNSQGAGAYSPSATATPNEKPGRPAAPTVSAASGASLRVSWTAPTNNGTAITDYDVQYKRSSASSWTSHAFDGTGTSATIGGLTAGATYNVQVRAANTAGESTWSASGSGTPNEKPGRPAAPTASAASATSLSVSWTAPTNNGTAITDYDVRYKRSSASSWTSHAFDGTGTSATIGSLTTGAAYNVEVRAGNAAGKGAWSPSGTGTPNETPGRPAAPTASAASGSSLSVSWTAPTNRGTAITDYDVRYKRSSSSGWTDHAFAGTGTSATIGGLTAGTAYNVQVRAGNAAGEGAWSPSGTGTPNEKPGRPAAPTVSAASGSSLSVSWTAPTNRGTAITDYDVRYKLSSSSGWTDHAFAGTDTSTTIGGLTAGAVYNVQVRAGNAAGEGDWSPSGTGTPNEKPGRPAAPSVACAGVASMRVSWTAPTNRGTAITDYDVRYKRSSSSSWTSHPFTGTGTATTIAGLTAGTTYNVQVRAGNAAGEGPYSPSANGPPSAKPGRPSAPRVSAASATSLRVSWTAPASACGAITDYDVRYKLSSSSGWTNHAFAGTGTATTTIARLTAGATYNVQVRAGNGAGEGAWSPSGSGTPNAKPGRPAAPSVASAGAASLRVSWTAPANPGTAITDYDVRYKRSSASSWTSHSFAGVRTSTTIAGLTTGTAYDAQVRAGNAAGEGPWSPSGSGTPRAVPDRPSAPTVSAASATSLRVSWTAPASGGSAITDYDVRYKRSSASTWTSHSFAGTGTSTTITGLATGRAHDVQVRAGNTSGEGAWSPSGTGTPNNVPGRPAAPTVVARSGTELNVSWRSPRNTGSAITDYDVRYKLSTAASWTDHPFSGTRRHTTIGGLTAGRNYNAQVRASNAVGTGGWSASGSGAPNEPPGQPAAPTVRIASGTSLAVSWTAPTNGGTAITGYDVGHRANGASAWRTHAFAGTRTSTTIAGLTAATRYSVRVRAGNAAGKGRLVGVRKRHAEREAGAHGRTDGGAGEHLHAERLLECADQQWHRHHRLRRAPQARHRHVVDGALLRRHHHRRHHRRPDHR